MLFAMVLRLVLDEGKEDGDDGSPAAEAVALDPTLRLVDPPYAVAVE